MSKVQLGTIHFSVPATFRNWYVGGIVNSESGFMVPTLISNAGYYRLIFGDFPYADMYEKLITDYNLPAVILPHITPLSIYNRSSVRLFRVADDIYYAHPRYKKSYTTSGTWNSPTESDFNEQFEREDLFYSTLLDFSKVDWSLSSTQYFCIQIGRDIVCFYINTAPNLEISSIQVQISDFDDLVQELKSQSDLTAVYDNQGEYESLVTDVWNSIFTDDQGQPLTTVNLDVTTEEGEENFNALIEGIYARSLYTLSHDYVVSEIKLRNFTTTATINNLTDIAMENNYKIVVVNSEISYDLNLYVFDGLTISPDYNSSQDQLCSDLNEYKLIDFYSKIKGPAGKNILVQIKESPYPNSYEINIDLGTLSESFICYLTKNDELPDDAIDLRLLGRYSQLVECKIYDYLDPRYGLIDQQDYFELHGTNEDYDPNLVINVELPIGSYTLNRNEEEVINQESYQNSLRIFMDSDFYPDLFLVPEVFYDDQLLDVLSLMRGSEDWNRLGCCEKGIYSQALVTLSKEHLGLERVNSYNRMLYFYDNISIDDISYPTFFPFINQIISGNLLEIPAENLKTTYSNFEVGNLVYCGTVADKYIQVIEDSDGIIVDTEDGIPNSIVSLSVDVPDGVEIVEHEVDNITGLLTIPSDVLIDPDSFSFDDELTGLLEGWSRNIVTAYGLTEILSKQTEQLLTLDGIEDKVNAREVIGDADVGSYVVYQGARYLVTNVEFINYYGLNGIDELVPESDLESIEVWLSANNINYLHYNNLYYFYPNLYETNNQKNLFIAQFNCSKVSRAFFDWGRNLKASNPSNYTSRVTSIISRLRSCLPYLSSISSIQTLNTNKLAIQVTTTMSRLVNKVFNINFEINFN